MGYNPNKICSKCSKRHDFLFYCEDCGQTICNDCIIMEKTECTFCNECSHISIGTKCEKCGKTNNLSTARRYLRRCPLCSSTRIKDIPKKISGLPSEYTDAVNLIYSGLDIIRNFATKFSDIVNQAKILRRERFGLYPNIENNLIRIQSQFYEITSRASELVDKVYNQMEQEAKLLKFNDHITVPQLPYVDKVLKMIKTHAQSYANLLDDFLCDSKKDLEVVEEYTKELNYYLSIFDEVSDKFEPEILELRIAAIPNIKISFPDSNHKQTGILFLTNKHIYFMPIHKFFFNLKGKIKALPISMIREIELKERKLLGALLKINIPDKKSIKIKCSNESIDRLNFLFGVLFNENEGYIISDPYILEELRATLNYNHLRDKIERRIKDLKQIPYSHEISHSQSNSWDDAKHIVNLPYETQEMKELRIKLRAAQDTLKQLTKAFEDRSITPDIYFSRLEKTQEKILYYEDQLREIKRQVAGLNKNQNILDSLRQLR